MQKPGSYVDRSIYEADPYCSSVCCKADHGLGERPFGERMDGSASRAADLTTSEPSG